jgi:type II secretory pathway pseudopilin PulG
MVHSIPRRRSGPSAGTQAPPSFTRRSAAGFSIMELVVVCAIIVVMISISVFAYMPSRRAYGVDEAAGQVHRFMRDAATRALTQRQRARVFININASSVTVPNATPTISCQGQTIMLVDEGAPGTGDERVARAEPLYTQEVVKIAQPGNLLSGSTQPPAPYNYTAALFTSGTWEGYFTPSGMVTTSTGAPKSATLYFYHPNQASTGNASNLSLVRAITVFGPTGNVRFWRYNVVSPTSATWIGR